MLPYNVICTENDNGNDLEDEMELRLVRDGQQVTLRLKKNDNVRDDVPVFKSKNKVVQKVDSTALPVSAIKTEEYCSIISVFIYHGGNVITNFFVYIFCRSLRPTRILIIWRLFW